MRLARDHAGGHRPFGWVTRVGCWMKLGERMIKYLPFIYAPEKSAEVLARTESYFESKPDVLNKITDLKWIYQSIGKTIPQTSENLFSGHFFPFFESTQEFEISFNLALFGLYKQAFMSLRSALEVGILSVYYNINDKGHKEVKDWLKSKDTWEANTPKTERIWKILCGNKNIETFNNKFNLRQRYDDLAFLHNYVHTKGHKYSNQLGTLKANYQTFEEDILLKWIETYEKAIMIVVILHMLKYPISIIEFDWHDKVGIDNPFPVLDSHEIERIKSYLPDEYVVEIQEISKNDPFTQELFAYISELPDMTEEQRDQQIIELDKSLIEHGQGYLEWEKQELEFSRNYTETDKKKVMKRMKVIKKWAIENNMLKPKLERLDEN
jgi:hypothetical protein